MEENKEIKVNDVKSETKQEMIVQNLGDQALKMVSNYVDNGQLVLPSNYSVENAMKVSVSFTFM